MPARSKNIAAILPNVLPPLQALAKAVEAGGVPIATLSLVHQRISQINGCGLCLDLDRQMSRPAPQSEERLYTLAGWRHTPYFTDAERAALALAEAATRMADRPDPVPDEVWEVWNEAARHYDERALATLVLHIAQVNTWNRLNVTTAQPAGSVRLPAAAQ